MITCEWLVVARGASIDRESSGLTLFVTLPGFRAESFPIFFPQIAIGGLLRREEGDPESPPCKLRISHDDETLFESPINVNFNGKHNNQIAITIQGFLIPAPGAMKFELLLGRRVIGKFVMHSYGPSAQIAETKTKSESTSTDTNITPKKQKKRARRKTKKAR